MTNVEPISEPEPTPRKRGSRAVATRESRAVAPAVPTPLSIVQAALASGNVDIYREAVALAKELDAIAARKAFDNAMADAKAKIPVIRKNRRVFFESKKGGADTDYLHEDMGEIARTIDPILSEHGLSYRFRVSSKIGEPVAVTCVVSHREGHFEETTLHAGRDESGNKNAIQGIGSTVTYLQRYTLKAALGLAVAADDDGRASEQPAEQKYTPPPESLSPTQVEELRIALQAKAASEKAFVQWTGCKRIEEIPAAKFEVCKRAIERHNNGSQQ